MRIRQLLTAATIGLNLSLFGPNVQTSVAIELSDGTTHFTQIPRLIDTQSTNQRVRAAATHYYTIDVPENAGEPLAQLTFTQTEGADRFWRYELDRIRAFEGTYSERTAELGLGKIDFDQETRTLTVRFDPPVPPGRHVTIGVPFFRNPSRGTILLFAVRAFPAGEQPASNFLGFGRFHFFERGGRDGYNF